MLSIRGLSLSYPRSKGDRVISDLSLDVPSGTLIALMGPSGCGKSTLLSALSGGLQPECGSITLWGETLDPHRQQIALVPQTYGLLEWRRVRDNIFLPERLGKTLVAPRDVDDILSLLGLRELLGRYPSSLSGGQRQRVALARAFVMKPDLLLLDEAFSALDLFTAERSFSLFEKLLKKYPTTAIMVTHNLEEACLLASRVVVMGSTGSIEGDLLQPSVAQVKTLMSSFYR